MVDVEEHRERGSRALLDGLLRDGCGHRRLWKDGLVACVLDTAQAMEIFWTSGV